MVNLVYCLTSLLFFDIPLLYHYINLRSSIIFCLFSGDMYFSLGIYLSIPIFFASFVTVSELFFSKILEGFLILSAIFLPIKSSVAFAVFWIALFEAVLSASVAVFVAWSRSFCFYLLLKFLLIFLPMLLHIFLAGNINP